MVCCQVYWLVCIERGMLAVESNMGAAGLSIDPVKRSMELDQYNGNAMETLGGERSESPHCPPIKINLHLGFCLYVYFTIC